MVSYSDTQTHKGTGGNPRMSISQAFNNSSSQLWRFEYVFMHRYSAIYIRTLDAAGVWTYGVGGHIVTFVRELSSISKVTSIKACPWYQFGCQMWASVFNKVSSNPRFTAHERLNTGHNVICIIYGVLVQMTSSDLEHNSACSKSSQLWWWPLWSAGHYQSLRWLESLSPRTFGCHLWKSIFNYVARDCF